MEPLLYTVQDAANRLGVSRNTVYNLVNEKKIPYMRLPSSGAGEGNIRIPREALEKWIEALANAVKE
jgi:excisionase family DNA binding protein